MMKKLGYGFMAALCLGTFANAFALTQEEAVKQWEAALRSGDAKKVVALFPDSYVKDANKVIQSFAENMDEELWNRSRETAALFVDVLAVQSENALGGGAFMGMQIPKSDEEKNKQVREGLKALANFLRSDSMGLRALRKSDVATLASGLMPAISKLAAESKPADKDETPPSSPFADIQMRQVEGKWIPADMAKGWKEGIDNALKGIKDMDFASAEGQATKAQVMTMMTSMQPMFKRLESAKSPEDFQMQMMMLMIPIMMQMSN